MPSEKNAANEVIALDLTAIENVIAIREPVLMLDSAQVVPGKSSIAKKCFSGEEDFWKGHFPGNPTMPGCWQLEMLGQAFILVFMADLPEGADLPERMPRLVSMEDIRFFSEVKPHMELEIHTELVSLRHGLAKGTAKGFCNGKCFCKASIVEKLATVQ